MTAYRLPVLFPLKNVAGDRSNCYTLQQASAVTQGIQPDFLSLSPNSGDPHSARVPLIYGFRYGVRPGLTTSALCPGPARGARITAMDADCPCLRSPPHYGRVAASLLILMPLSYKKKASVFSGAGLLLYEDTHSPDQAAD